MLRAVLKGNHKSWDEYFPHIEFAYNRVVHKTTKISPFEVVNGFNPLTPLDLIPNNFNVSDLIPFAGYDVEDDPTDLRTNPSQEGGDDRPWAKGPITRAGARRIQEELDLLKTSGLLKPKVLFTWTNLS
uniref:Transposon Ty3-I Gag-Pol polyprotein n=1 Tax=Cajanus cajan TaxID=3821 RepID=A0A151QMI8_CAJCA|nr:hypothetical protein KK1_048111 [Cajanus cajan]